MKELDSEKFRKGAKELERKAAVVREAISIIESMPKTRKRRRRLTNSKSG